MCPSMEKLLEVLTANPFEFVSFLFGLVSFCTAWWAIHQAGQALITAKTTARPWLYFRDFDIKYNNYTKLVEIRAIIENSGTVPSTNTRTLFQVNCSDEEVRKKIEFLNKQKNEHGDVLLPHKTMMSGAHCVDFKLIEDSLKCRAKIKFLLYSKYRARGYPTDREVRVSGEIKIENLSDTDITFIVSFGPDPAICT